MERSFMYLNFKLFFLSLWVFWGIYSFNFISAEEFVIRPLKINIFSMQNGKGLETDQNILKDTLEHLGHTVQCAFPKKTQAQTQADINIFVEFIHPQKLSWAKINWFIPNPEWYRQDLELLDRFDLILCRTKEVERIFQKLHKRTYFLSFTSPDCYQVNVPKNYELFAHLPGGSWQKGTLAIKNIWESNSQFPMLMIVNFLKNKLCPAVSFDNLTWIARRLREDDFRALQNHCGIHLCLSETEGFGHYLMEAMSTGAVILTTDAPPMNKFFHAIALRNWAIMSISAWKLCHSQNFKEYFALKKASFRDDENTPAVFVNSACGYLILSFPTHLEANSLNF